MVNYSSWTKGEPSLGPIIQCAGPRVGSKVNTCATEWEKLEWRWWNCAAGTYWPVFTPVFTYQGLFLSRQLEFLRMWPRIHVHVVYIQPTPMKDERERDGSQGALYRHRPFKSKNAVPTCFINSCIFDSLCSLVADHACTFAAQLFAWSTHWRP